MTTETILTDEIITELAAKHLWAHAQFIGAGEVYYEGEIEFARAIEQAVLQSPEVQELRKDAERYRATRAGLVGTDPDYGSRFCKYCDSMGIKQAENITEEQFDAATDAAMEKQQ